MQCCLNDLQYIAVSQERTAPKVKKRSPWTPQPKLPSLPFSLFLPPPLTDPDSE